MQPTPPACQAVRDVAKAKEVAAELELPKDSYTIMPVELSSLASVNKFSEDVLKLGRKIDVLVCNAAVYLPNQQAPTWTEDGYEMSFGVNHLAHHLLVRKLLPELKKQKGARCVIVGSITGNSNTVGGGAVLPVADRGALKGARSAGGRARGRPRREEHAGRPCGRGSSGRGANAGKL